MATRQIRAQLNAPKRKYALPLLIPRLRQRQRAQTLRQEWNTAQANNQPQRIARAYSPKPTKAAYCPA